MDSTWRSVAAGLIVTAAFHAPARAQGAAPDAAALVRRLDALAAELAEVKAQLAQLRQRAAPAAPAAVAAAAGTPAPGPALAMTPDAGRHEPATVLSSYGEINYNRPTHASENTRADLRRFVLGFQHRFDARTRVVAELEVEHAVASSGDSGEVALEQAFVERQFTPTWAARGGLFLMPAGLLNENHEPTAYYGVERNFVETAIIPSTWREGGVQLIGAFDNGLTLQGGVSTSFDLTKWDATSDAGRLGPLASVHQELQLAKARDLAGFAAVNWRGIPGVHLGGSFFSGGATHRQAGFADARVTLWDVHARLTPGRWDLAALYSRGTISNTAALNAVLVGNDTLIPKSFDGWYGQAAYRVWSRAEYALTPFVRWEQFNTGRQYADLGAGLTPDGLPTERVLTLGANFQLAQGVVLKTDVQRFRENPARNRFDLGLGWSF